MNKSDMAAKFIRTVTVPPVMVTILMLILSYAENDLFQSNIQIVYSIFLLGFVPLLAYPLQHIIPYFKRKGREGQRILAFILNLIGYAIAVLWGYISKVGIKLQFIYNTYFISVILLTICNKFFHLRASGHACSATGPLLFLAYFIGGKVFIPCICVGIAIVWSSLKLKRHTIKDIIMGSFTCVLSFVCTYLIFKI